MYTHSRLTSGSSYETNASGSTDRTDLSGDDVIVDCAKNSKTHTSQGIGYLGGVRNTSSLDSNFESQRRNLHLAEERDRFGYLSRHVQLAEQNAEHLWMNSERGNVAANRESVPLLVRSKREYAVHDIIRSEEFKKFFESEYAEIVKFRKNYKSLKKLFLTLAALNIILIICAVSVMPVIMVSVRLENSHAMSDKAETVNSFDVRMAEFVFEKLDSPRAREIIRHHARCDNCHRLSDTINTCESDIQKVRQSIDELEDAVITLQLNGPNSTDNGTGKHLRSNFQKTVVHERVEYNNKLVNKLLNWKRSSMQLTGTVTSGQIVWEQDVSSGNIMSGSNNGIHVKSGGTFFLYTKIQFSKKICTGTELFEYHVMKEKGSTNTPISHAKQRCAVPSGSEQSLHIQKVVKVPLSETATFYIKYNSVAPAFFSKDFRTHVFGIIEI